MPTLRALRKGGVATAATILTATLLGACTSPQPESGSAALSQAPLSTVPAPQQTSYTHHGFTIRPADRVSNPTQDDSVTPTVWRRQADDKGVQGFTCKPGLDILQQTPGDAKYASDAKMDVANLGMNEQTYLDFIFPGDASVKYELYSAAVQTFQQTRTRYGALVPIVHDAQLIDLRGSASSGGSVASVRTADFVKHGYVGLPTICAKRIDPGATPRAVG